MDTYEGVMPGKQFIDLGNKKEEEKAQDKIKVVYSFLKKHKNLILIILLLVILLTGFWIRILNLPLLFDNTTGNKIPLALDPFYFLRMAETIVSQGSLPAVDIMRYPAAEVSFTNEITPHVLVLFYKISNVFGDVSLQSVDLLYPAIFFALSLILFFFLVLLLTKSKITALLSCWFLAIIPTYLYRTMAGFSDHEPIGIFSFFATMLVFTLGLKFLRKKEGEKIPLKRILLGLLTGFLTALTIASWGGIVKFIFMIIPLTIFVIWLLRSKHNLDMKKYLAFYLIWFASSILFSVIFGFSISEIINRYVLNLAGLISLFTLVFLIIDYVMINFKDKIKFNYKKENRIFYSLCIALFLGLIFVILFKGGFSTISDIFSKFLQPFGDSRTASTVSENQQPYLKNWINQTGKIFFWVFFLGIVTLGINLSKNIKKGKIAFVFFWMLLISGILFSRISSASLLNGTNFISKLFYFGSLILFIIYFIWIYVKRDIKIKNELVLIATWVFVMLIATRGAIRFFFFITPLVCFLAAYCVMNIFNYLKKTKDEVMKPLLIIGFIIIIICLLISSVDFLNASKFQSKNTGPSANIQWQNAMEWVRENTVENSIFIHWWDYGYWVQYLGKRPTVTDGGHEVGYWDHLIGRYLLTTPQPETALSLMKSHDVSYLLIDPTDLGKYGAYSKIGSDGKDNNYDRFSQIPIGTYDPAQTYETAEEITNVYSFGMGVDEDIIYGEGGQESLIPGPSYDTKGTPTYKSAIGGVILSREINSLGFKQPQGLYIYNGQQYVIPLRYLYIEEEMIDFGKGLDAGVSIIPSVKEGEGGMIGIDGLGTMVYLSPKTFKSLFVQLYLLNDFENNYSTLQLKHAEPDTFVTYLKNQGLSIGDFVYYRELKGPIKIWETNYPENILIKEEFIMTGGKYAELDDLNFIESQ